MSNFFGTLLIIYFAFAGKTFAAGQVSILYSLPSPEKSHLLSCHQIQTPVFVSVKHGSVLLDSGEFRPLLQQSLSKGRKNEWVTTAFKVFQKWVHVHRYTTADKIPALMELDQALSPTRTSYFHFESEQDQIAIRMFDGSKNVLHAEGEWREASRTDSRLPIERIDPDLRLPERAKPQAHLIELGLLEVTENVSQGMRWAFARIADHIDARFNGLEYMSFGRGNMAQQKGLAIYAQTREAQVKMFERFGLKPVLDTDGQMKKLSSGLILLKAEPEQFLKLNFLPQTQPLLKGQDARGWSEGLIREMHQKHTAYMRNLESNKLQISHPKEILEIREALKRVLTSASREVAGSPAQAEKILLFFNTYFRVIDSLPPSFRSENWSRMRQNILQAMMQADPFSAYHYFYLAMEGKANTQSLSPEAEVAFYSKMPVLNNIYFGSIADGAFFIF